MTLLTPGEPASAKGEAKAATAEPNWFASYPAGVPRTIDPDVYPSLSAMLLAACRQHAERPAFEFLQRADEFRAMGSRQPRLCGVPGRRSCAAGRASASRSCCRTCSPIRWRFSARCAAGLTVGQRQPALYAARIAAAARRFRRDRHRHHGEFRPQACKRSSPKPRSAMSWSRGSAILCPCSSAGHSISPTPISATRVPAVAV